MRFIVLAFAFVTLNLSAAVKTGEYTGTEMWNLLNSKVAELSNQYCVVAGLRTYDKLSLNAAVGNKLTSINLSEDFFETPENSGTYKKVIKVVYKFVSDDEQIIDNHTIRCGLK